jgi:hypothetical protein
MLCCRYVSRLVVRINACANYSRSARSLCADQGNEPLRAHVPEPKKGANEHCSQCQGYSQGYCRCIVTSVVSWIILKVIYVRVVLYTGSSTYDQPPFWLVGRKSALYLLTVFFKLSNLIIIFTQFIFNLFRILINTPHATDAWKWLNVCVCVCERERERERERMPACVGGLCCRMLPYLSYAQLPDLLLIYLLFYWYRLQIKWDHKKI